jgi:hypothetical protein
MARKPKSAEYSDIARGIAANSIVTHALSRLIEQIVSEVHAAEKEKQDELEAQLAGYAEARNAAFAERDLATARVKSTERKLAMAVEASKAIIHLLKPAKGEAHGQLEGVPDSHLFELVWARDDDGPQDYPCITAGQLRRFVAALTELEKADDH